MSSLETAALMLIVRRGKSVPITFVLLQAVKMEAWFVHLTHLVSMMSVYRAHVSMIEIVLGHFLALIKSAYPHCVKQIPTVHWVQSVELVVVSSLLDVWGTLSVHQVNAV